MEKINQLNILRESNATLRSESESNRQKTKQLEQQLRQVQADIDPVKAELRTAKADLEAKSLQVKLFRDESERWKSRNTELLQKVNIL